MSIDSMLSSKAFQPNQNSIYFPLHSCFTRFLMQIVEIKYYTSLKSFPREIPPMKLLSTYPHQELAPQQFLLISPEIRQSTPTGGFSNQHALLMRQYQTTPCPKLKVSAINYQDIETSYIFLKCWHPERRSIMAWIVHTNSSSIVLHDPSTIPNEYQRRSTNSNHLTTSF